jgi:transposase-like protein
VRLLRGVSLAGRADPPENLVTRGSPYPTETKARWMAALIVGESVPDVAAAFNVPPKTVRSWLGEARSYRASLRAGHGPEVRRKFGTPAAHARGCSRQLVPSPFSSARSGMVRVSAFLPTELPPSAGLHSSRGERFHKRVVVHLDVPNRVVAQGHYVARGLNIALAQVV